MTEDPMNETILKGEILNGEDHRGQRKLEELFGRRLH
jgi:hypothetical protein